MKRISDPKNWFFRKCSGCDLELEHEGGKFKCSRANGCGRIIPYPEKRCRIFNFFTLHHYQFFIFKFLSLISVQIFVGTGSDYALYAQMKEVQLQLSSQTMRSQKSLTKL